ncbi:MAG: hypothetical protein LUF27_06490 [Lachnospiraceae bacterium]|nr:hypothetical protein [Lachnospiraceae bacterium]
MEGVKEKGLQNVFTYEKSGRAVQIHLSSIHAVKGKTHLAILVLDTFWKKRNIKSIVPFLYGSEKLSDKTGKDQLKRAKCHYVALTRAKGLICIAAKKDSLVESDIELLNSLTTI